MIVTGLIACVGGCPHASVPEPLHVGAAASAVGVFVVLHAFASGSTALTGIEAISNGVDAFRKPKGDNAAATLAVMGVIAITLFLGVSFLAVAMHAAPSHSASVLSQIARAVFPTGSLVPGAFFYVVQLLTFAILVLAANGAFQGFPRLASLLARDEFLPRHFQDLGDRLVYSDGALALAALSTILILAFNADVTRLVQLHVVGVFTAFTLSQLGMVRHWRKRGGAHRQVAINATGTVATALVALIVIATKFAHGAWVAIVAMALIVLALRRHRRHCGALEARARRAALTVEHGPIHNIVLLYVERVDAATHEALSYIHHLDEDEVQAIHLPGRGSASDIQRSWRDLGDPLKLVVLEAPRAHDPVGTVVEHVRSLERRQGFITVVIPELLRKASLAAAIRQRSAFKVKLRLLCEPRVVVTDVPVLDEPGRPALAAEHINPDHSAAFVLVQEVDDATVQALNYARSLHAFETRALFFALHPERTDALQGEWEARQIPIPLDVVECPFRELATPLLERLAPITRHRDGIAAVVLPELVNGGRLRSLAHNREALYLKWLLLFEPRVVLSSVPYPLAPEAPRSHPPPEITAQIRRRWRAADGVERVHRLPNTRCQARRRRPS